MRHRPTLIFIAGLFAGAVAPAAEPARLISYEHEITPLLMKYCYDCHGDGVSKAGLALDSYESPRAGELSAQGDERLGLLLLRAHVGREPGDARPRDDYAGGF
ncbi:MAG: hypothetical protein H7343_10955 [Undibacterium sp.]|nr:hypothetical protein [Opitutaceae bacterium]